MKDNQTYDLSYLKNISDGDEKFVKDMIYQFIQEAPQVLLEMSEYMDQGKWDEMYLTLHRFAPTLDFIGLTHIHNLVLDIEKRAYHQENLNNIADSFSELTDHCLKAIEDLKQDFEL